MYLKRSISLLLALCISSCLLRAQQQAEPLSVATITLPKANFRQEYRAALTAHGGVPPYQWQVTDGELPVNLDLSEDGVISGLAKQLGEFHFAVTVTDSSKPPHTATKEFTMRTVTPLLAEWVQLPMLSGQHASGKIKVTNGTDDDFDLTFIALAVNEIGRATALGYQHFVLKKEISDFELSFGQDLPRGVYDISVDVVAEDLEKNAIYRVHLSPANKLRIEQGP